MDPNLLVEARSLGVSYGAKRALDGVSFTIPRGRVVGLLGHNGAGKTTLMKALVGLVKPAQGDFAVLGLDPLRDRVALLEQACYIPDVAILPRWARVNDLIGLMSGLHPRFSAERARALLRRTSVDPADKVKTLSKGMVVQAHLALVAAIDARLMILDEPTLGLDVLSRKAFYEMLMTAASTRWPTTRRWPSRWPRRTRCCATASARAARALPPSSTAARRPACRPSASACGRAWSTCSSR